MHLHLVEFMNLQVEVPADGEHLVVRGELQSPDRSIRPELVQQVLRVQVHVENIAC